MTEFLLGCGGGSVVGMMGGAITYVALSDAQRRRRARQRVALTEHEREQKKRRQQNEASLSGEHLSTNTSNSGIEGQASSSELSTVSRFDDLQKDVYSSYQTDSEKWHKESPVHGAFIVFGAITMAGAILGTICQVKKFWNSPLK
jgi:hypothetical protein